LINFSCDKKIKSQTKGENKFIMNKLELIDICYRVDDKIILNNINLSLSDKKLYVITGKNGSGKTTLVKIIMGILKPTSGKILFNEQDITNLSIDERAKIGFAFAFQQPIKFKGITVKKLLDISHNKENKILDCCDYLSKVGLCARDYIDREFNNNLSGGELKRIEIATVLARKAKVSIFDEPEAGIDLWNFDNLIKIFEELKSQSLCIVISHEEKILELADNIIILNDTNIEKQGTRKEILANLSNNICTKLKRGE